MPRLTAIAFCIIASVISAAALAAPQPAYLVQHDPIGAIEADYHAGALTFSQKAVLQVKAIKQPKQLPAKYQIFDPTTGRSYGRSATLALRDIVVNWNSLDAPSQSYIQQALSRQSTAFTYVSATGFFRLHYDTSGTNAVPTADINSNGVPDYVERCAAYVDTSYTTQMALGYMPPPSDGTLGGDGKYDVYFEEMNLYGYAMPENPGPQPWSDYTSYLVLHRDFLGFPPDTDPEGNQAGAAKATAAHEFHHSIQFAYDVNEASWFMELDATWMEDIVFDQVNDNYNYLPLFMNYPQTSLMDNSNHYYASFPWDMYLSERFDTSLMRAAWEGARYKSIFNALSDSLMGRYGWSQDSAFAEFALWNYYTGSRDDGQHYAEGAAYLPSMAIGRTHTTYPTFNQTAPSKPQGYAASYISFVPNGASGTFRLRFDGEDGGTWAAYLVKKFLNGTTTSMKIPLSGPSWADTIDVLNFTSYQSLTLVVANISEFDIARDFTYSAEVVQPYAIAATFVGDSGIYSGSQREVYFRVTNQSQTADAIKVTHSDGAGWMTPGSTTYFLGSGDSTTIGVMATVPAGTPLGAASTVTFVAQSQNDPVISQTRQRNQLVVIQRGDVSFSGKIDLTDLSMLIAYLLGYGPPPQPVMEAGNFNCTGIVDLADLSALISYLTGAGPKSPCNPY